MGVKDDRAAAIRGAAMDRLKRRGADKERTRSAAKEQHTVRRSFGTRSKVSPTREDVIEAVIEALFDDSE